MRVATLQIASPTEEPVSDRLARIDARMRAESDLAACDLVVLPELWGVGGFHFDDYRAASEPFEGPSLALARSWAELHDVNVHVGSFVEAEGDRLYNTTAVVAPDGAVLAKYRKVHLFGRDEARMMTPGDALALTPLADTSLAIATCYDLRFPELFRSIIDAGATTAAVCAAWPEARLEHWRLFTTARAVEEQMYVIGCNAVGAQRDVTFPGHSRVVDPWGTIIAEADDQEGFLYADLDPELPAKVRRGFPAIADRRWRP